MKVNSVCRLLIAVCLCLPVQTFAQTSRPAALDLVRLRPQKHVAKSHDSAQSLFGAATAYDAGGSDATSVAVGDLNGDGKPDIVLANFCGLSGSASTSTGVVGVLLGNGDGTFGSTVTYGTGGYAAESVALADVDRDGKLDIVVANFCTASGCLAHGSVAVLLGNGDGTFQAAVTYDSGAYDASALAVGDLNNDGKLDLVVANECDSATCLSGTSLTVSVLLGNGNGTFQPAVLYGSGGIYPTSIVIGDINTDGELDLIVANACAALVNGNCAPTAHSVAAVLVGNGDGTFQSAVTYDSGVEGPSRSAALGDLNLDGKPDLAIVDDCCSVSILLGNGNGTFQQPAVYGLDSLDVRGAAFGDVNGDLKPDLLISFYCVNGSTCANGAVGVLLGNGDGTLQSAVTYSSGGYGATAVAASDLNADGKLDVVLSNQCAGLVDGWCTANASVGVLLNTSLAYTTTSLVSSANPSSFGQSVTFTATVTATKGGTPTGTVTFYDGTNSIGSSALNGNATATFSTSSLSIGTHSVTAVYGGDSQFASSTSPALNQVIQGAIVVISPTTIGFGNQTVGIASGPMSTILTNTGNISLTISLIAITGTNASDFMQTNTCNGSVSPNSSCGISVTFTPGGSGSRTATIMITDNASNSPQSISLTGTGVLPSVTLSPQNLTFSTQLIFTSSKGQTVTLTNTGLGLLTISSVVASGQFSETNTCGASVNPGAMCSISVTFKPTMKGAISGSVLLTDNATGSPQKITLSGTGTYVQLSPTTVNFGTQPVGTTSLAKKITFSNKGSVSVSVSSISITGTNAPDFAETNNCGKSVAAGGSCFVKVTFTPSAKGARTGAVSITDNGGGSPQKVSLTGTGT